MTASALLTLEGILSWCTSFLIYTVALASRGKNSMVHYLLFDGLDVFSPTNTSVAIIAGVSSGSAAVPKTLQERLEVLEIASRTVDDGMIAVDAMKVKETALIWKRLEYTACLVIGCTTALVLMETFRWLQAWRKPCCIDIGCWTDWIRNDDDAKPIVAVMATVALQSTLHMGQLVSKMPKGSPLVYAPPMYVTAWVWGLGLFFSSKYNSSLDDAMEEFVARILLFSRVVGVRVEDELAALERGSVYFLLVLSLLAGYTGFCLTESVKSFVDLFMASLSYRGSCSLERVQHQNGSMGNPSLKVNHRCSHEYTLVGMILAGVIPTVIVVLYFMDIMATFRLYLTIAVVVILCLLAKPLLQCHLFGAIPAIQDTLDTSDETITSDKVIQPFLNRRRQLRTKGGKLLQIPCLLMCLVTMQWLCSDVSTIHPVGYAGVLTPAYGIAHSHNCAKLQQLVATRSNSWSVMAQHAARCDEMLPESAEANSTNVSIPVVHRGRDLLNDEFRASTSWSIASSLIKLQERSATTTTHVTNVKEASVWNDQEFPLSDLLWSLVEHPFITSTIARPILDLFFLLIWVYWLQALVFGVAVSVSYQKQQQQSSDSVRQTKKKT